MSPAQIRLLERLPAPAAAHYRTACGLQGGAKVAALRDAQDAIDTATAGCFGPDGICTLLQREIVAAEEAAA